MSKQEAERQIERVKFLRELAEVDRQRAERLDERAQAMEIEALETLSELWRQEHSGQEV